MFKQKCIKKKKKKKSVFKEILTKKYIFRKNIIKKIKYHQSISKTQPALNDPLRFICRKTKQKQVRVTIS